MTLNGLATGLSLLIAGIALGATFQRVSREHREHPGSASHVALLAASALEPSLHVSGRVVDVAGRPVAGVVVMAAQQGHVPAPPAMDSGVLTDEHGRFAIGHLPPGAYSFVAIHGRYPLGTASLVLTTQSEAGGLQIVLCAEDELIEA